MRTISILGATGSIGQSTLTLIRHQSKVEHLKIIALSANNNVSLLAKNAKEFNAKYAVITNEDKYSTLKELVAGSGVTPLAGVKSLHEIAGLDVDWTINAIVGFAGLKPSLQCAKNGKTLALANKESLVCGGHLLINEINKYKGQLLPVDSEHSAIFQCLKNEPKTVLSKIILTASGGPFRAWPVKNMEEVNLEQAINHPNWQMGTRISIDSATMFNKTLEVIETKYLFDIPVTNIEVLVHPESIVHSLVEFKDHSVIAQLGVPDMKGAIGYALNYPERRELPVKCLDLSVVKSLNFEKVDLNRFPALKLAYRVQERGDLFGCVLNASKEIALDKFIEGKIKFLDIARLVENVIDSKEIQHIEGKTSYDFTDVLEADMLARQISLRAF